MIRDKEFYGISDILHFNVYASLLKEHIIKEERVIIKVFKKDNQVVVIETNNYVDTILKDTRIDKNDDLMTYDLVFLKTLDRYYCDYEIPGMVYENMEGIGSWYRVKIDGYDPYDKLLKPFFLKKKITKEDLKRYADNELDLQRLEKFYDITKGLVKFSKMKDVEKLFSVMEN